MDFHFLPQVLLYLCNLYNNPKKITIWNTVRGLNNISKVDRLFCVNFSLILAITICIYFINVLSSFLSWTNILEFDISETDINVLPFFYLVHIFLSVIVKKLISNFLYVLISTIFYNHISSCDGCSFLNLRWHTFSYQRISNYYTI